MDYAIYKTNDDREPRVIHSFTQQQCDHKAKCAARAKLDDMRYRALQHTALYRNFHGTKDDFEYGYITSVNTTEHIRFFIAPLK